MGEIAVQRIFAVITVPVLLLLAFGLLAMNWSRNQDTAGTSRDSVNSKHETKDSQAAKNSASQTSAKKTTGEEKGKSRETITEKFARLLAEEVERKSAGARRSESQTPPADSSPDSEDGPANGVALEPPANLPTSSRRPADIPRPDSIAPLMPLSTQTRLVRIADELDDLGPNEVIRQLIITGDQFTNRSLRSLDGKQILSLSIEAVNVTNAGLHHLTKVKNLRELRLWAPGVDDDGLQILAKIQRLERLDLEGTNVRGVGLTSAASLQRLRHLTLGPKTQEQELQRLEAFPSLEELDLRSCSQLTDACVDSLGLLQNLRVLWIPKQLSETSRKAIRKGLTQCQIRL
jgi:hypothetical protein